MKFRRSLALSAAALCGLLVVGATGVSVAQSLGNGWLMGAETDAKRFQLLQDDLGGFSRAMLDVSVRYERMYQAIEVGNLALAGHYWGGIKGSIENGTVRRPRRAANAEKELLATRWGEVDAVFKGTDAVAAQAAFMSARSACMSCHVAEGLEYLNRQPLFDNLVFPR